MANISNIKLHFPARLYQLIESEDDSIIAWEVDGRSFRIVDSKRFRAETVPKYFRHGNMASIQRQLNLYGFRCTNRIDEKGVFHHPQFIRGQYDLVRNIRRKRTWPTKRPPKELNNNNVVATSFAGSVAASMPPPYYVIPAPAANVSSYGSCFSLVKPDNTGMTSNFLAKNGFGSPCMQLPEGVTPLSHWLSSDELLSDLLDIQAMDNIENIMINATAMEAGDFDQGLLNLFDNDQLPRAD